MSECQSFPKLAGLAGGLLDANHFRVFVHADRDGVEVGRAEAAREGELRLPRELLTPEADHRKIEKSAMDLGENGVVHGQREIYPGDHGAECARDRVDVDALEAHGAANLAGTAERAQSTTQALSAAENS